MAYLKPFQSRMSIHIQKVDDADSERRITNQSAENILYFEWKESDTLVFVKDFGGDENYHIFTASVSGEKEKDLTPFKDTKVGVVDWLDGISEDHILIRTNQRLKTVFDVYRLNIKTGEKQLLVKNPGHFISYLTDHEGKLRVAVSQDGVERPLYYRETEEEEFQKILTMSFKDYFVPIIFTFDNKNLYIGSNINRDKMAIEIFDPREKKVLSTVFSHPEVDVGGLGYSKKRQVLTDVAYTTWKPERHFFDAVYKRIHQQVQSKFPDKEVSFISTNREEDMKIAFIYSDRNPGSYYLYHVKNNNLEKLAEPFPWLKKESLVEMRPIKYTSRDGLTIHGYLFLPKQGDGRNLPVVVNPHGGPIARDSWGYSPESQFLASRGYVVFKMNFRGSSGYGEKVCDGRV